MMAREKTFMDHVTVPSDDAALLDECRITTFRSSGKGGQHVNKTDSAVRLRHNASGITVTCRRERSQYRNKMICLDKLRKRLEELLEVRELRVPTSIPVKAKRKRCENKMHQSKKKRMRIPPVFNDD